LGSLSGGRVSISRNAVESAKRALVIAIRYSAVRAQFGLKGKPESPVIEYQLQQYRLLPFVAATIANHFFCEWLSNRYNEVSKLQMKGDASNQFLAMNEEIHAISSGSKVRGFLFVIN
jgi:acyl-CoA oxidase